MKLDYTIEELRALSKEQLIELKDQVEEFASQKDVEQHSLKININSFYGANANKNFIIFNPDIAGAITSGGRLLIQMLANQAEEKWQKVLPSHQSYVVYGDTDSLVFPSKININGLFKIQHNPKTILCTKSSTFLHNGTIITFEELKNVKDSDTLEPYENCKYL